MTPCSYSILCNCVWVSSTLCMCMFYVLHLWMKVTLSWHQRSESDESCVLAVETLSQQGPQDPMVRAQTWKYMLVMASHMTTAVVVTWAAGCDSSQCLCYITNRHWAGGNNSPIVCSTKGNVSEWTERGGGCRGHRSWRRGLSCSCRKQSWHVDGKVQNEGVLQGFSC